MYIHEVCQETKLTKKAVEYYEKQGLIHPATGENGYRRYSVDDRTALKEISVLRKLGLSVADIQKILLAGNKPEALSKCAQVMELELQRSAARLDCIDQLIKDYDMDRAMVYMEDNIDKRLTVKEKLLQAFPGGYGMYLCTHFGRFLNEIIDSEEKAAAYRRITGYLDSIENMDFPDELAEYLTNALSGMQKEHMEQMHNSMIDALNHMDTYMEENKVFLEEYLEMRNSDAFKNTDAYKIQQMLYKFQQSTGYYDVFIHNLKILSASYREYVQKLEQANEKLLEKYPRAKDIHS